LGLSLLSVALGKLPIETKGGYWSVMAFVRDEASPSLPEGDDRWSEEVSEQSERALDEDENTRDESREMSTDGYIHY